MNISGKIRTMGLLSKTLGDLGLELRIQLHEPVRLEHNDCTF
jgi:hypothetical protein